MVQSAESCRLFPKNFPSLVSLLKFFAAYVGTKLFSFLVLTNTPPLGTKQRLGSLDFPTQRISSLRFCSRFVHHQLRKYFLTQTLSVLTLGDVLKTKHLEDYSLFIVY